MPAELAREAARTLEVVASVTGPVDHVSDGERVVAVANGDALLAAVTGTGCMSTAITGAFLAAVRARRSRRAARRCVAFGVAGEDAARRREGPGHIPRGALRRARGARPGHARRARAGREREAARRSSRSSRRRSGAVDGRRDRRPAAAEGRVDGRRSSRAAAASATLDATFVVNDDVEAALALGADGVHLGRDDEGAERALAAGLLLGLSAVDVERGASRRRPGAGYVGAGPVWATPSKPDADPPIGLDGPARDLRCRLGARRRDRRRRRVERGRVHRGRRGRRRRHPRRRRGPARCGEPSMRLSELGELGLIAELERRGLAAGDRARRGRRRRARRHAGRARRGRPLPARLALVARPRLPRRPR